MAEELDPLFILDAAGDGQLSLLLLLFVILIILLGFSITSRLRKKRNSIFILIPALLSFSIIFYADFIHFAGVAALHDSQANSGPWDPRVLNIDQAKFNTTLAAFRFLALVSMLIALFGACVHRTSDGHKEPVLDSPKNTLS